MSRAFRLIGPDGSIVGDVDRVDEAIQFVREGSLGRYRLVNLYVDRDEGDLRSWEWGEIVKDESGEIYLETPPWID